MKSPRNINLDLLRATAILMVIASHLPVMAPERQAAVLRITSVGQFGVELFFVLSGWLIGGLYWREQTARGSVDVPHFILRRVSRTVPPYLVALFPTWLAARWLKPDSPAFDFGYLIFIQNFYEHIPYFAVSWSLCIEEHFYLIVPFLLRLLQRGTVVAHHLFFAVLFALPAVFRCAFYSTQTVGDFDQTVLSTHVHFEALVAGVWISWIAARDAITWQRLERIAQRIWPVAAASFALCYVIPSRTFYLFGFSFTAIVFALVLVGTVNRATSENALTRFLTLIARSSFSIYLTHSLTLHLALRIARRVGVVPQLVYYITAFALIAIAGAVFYRFVEKPSINLRQRLWPDAMKVAKLPVATG